MYQTARSQRNFTGHTPAPKLDPGQHIQYVRDKATGELRTIIHDGTTPAKELSVKWFARHGIRPGTVIANAFRLPKSKMKLRAEAELIRLKKSTLSARQRWAILEALNPVKE